MKLIILVLTFIMCGCGNPYPNENKLIQKAYRDGYEQGIISERSFEKIKMADSIEFKYDSIMVIHYNQSEVK